MVNNSPNINQNHISLQLIEGGIVDHHSMSWGERWFLLILVELFTITQWVEVRCDFCWYWWNCWPSPNVLRWEVHQYQKQSPLTSTHWMMVNNSTNINKNHLSLQLIEWWSTIPLISTKIAQWVEVRGDFCWYWWNCWPSLNELRWEVIFLDIGGIVDHHSMSWGERWFVMVNNSTNINKNHLSP
jgi:hypothetical protein